MKRPLVSVVVPCFNGEKYIDKLIKSILDQTYKDIQLIVVDDGSTDKTLNILNSYQRLIEAKGIDYVVISKTNGGLVSAINAALPRVAGDYLNFIGQDDFFTSDSIKKRANYLTENKDIDVVWSKSNVVDELTGEIIDVWGEVHTKPRKSLFDDMIDHRDYVWPPAAKMIRGSTFFSINKNKSLSEFDPGENIQIFLPIYYKGNNVGYIDEVLAYITDNKSSHSRKTRSEDEIRKYQNEIRDTFIDTLRKIDMPSKEREEYMARVYDRYKKYSSKRVFTIVDSEKDEISKLYDYDEQKFRNSYMSDVHTADQVQLASKLVFSSHSLEKSLSNDNFEIGHGFMVSRMLIEMLEIYKSKRYDQGHLSFINTLSVLKEFHSRHSETEFVSEIESIFGSLMTDILECDSKIGGSDQILLKDKLSNDKKNFKELATGRFAVRTYSSEPVDKKDIAEAIEISMKTPTVCNRQSLRVRSIYSKDLISRVLEIQGGIAYYDTPPVLLLITADDRGYIGANERNQGFIDGGLFAMSVLYALEYKKLAACPLNAMFNESQEKHIRGILNIPDSEKFITFISVGHFNKVNNVCKSFRYSVDYVLSEVKDAHDYSIETVVPEDNIDKAQQDLVAKRRNGIGDFLRYVKHKARIRTRINNFITGIFKYNDKRKLRALDGAILTLTGYYNYGNVIQRYALQKFLRLNGYNFVSYVDPFSSPRAVYSIGRRVRFKKPLRGIKRLIANQKPYWYTPGIETIYPEVSNIKNIVNFVNRNIWIKQFDPQDDFKNYIVGSDQVWRNWWGRSDILGYYFLNFLEGNKSNRISYAASFGNDRINEVMSEDDVHYVSSYIKSFNRISVREGSGAKLIEDTWGIDEVAKVVDPTLLLDSSDYSELIDKSEMKSVKIHPIFTYVLDETAEVAKFIKKIQHERKQPATKIRAHQGSEGDTLPHVELWLKGFRDSDIVITNSFHGMMFSIINNTEFIIIGRQAGGLSRIMDFLTEFDLVDRYVDESDLDAFSYGAIRDIDWRIVNSKLKKLKEYSGKWLIDSIDGSYRE